MDDLGVRQQRADQRRHRRRAEQQRLVRPAGIEDAIGEDVPTIEVGRDLDLVDRKAVDRNVERHCFDSRHPIARLGRNDPLLAGHQRHSIGTDTCRDTAIDLTREEAQRQADHPRAVRQHPFDGEVGLARIGGPQDGLEGGGVGHLRPM